MSPLGVRTDALSRRLRQAVEPTLTVAERRRIARRLGGGLLAGVLLAVGLIHRHLFPGQEEIAALVLAAGGVVAAGPVVQAGLAGFVRRDPDATLDQLVGLAVLASLATGDFETAILVPLVMAAGHFFEERGLLGARAAIEGLATLRPAVAARLEPGGEEAVPVERLRAGDHIVVRPGEAFPADGRVVRGASAVDQSTMTGESAAEEVSPGSRVFAGTANLSGLLVVEVTDLGEASALGRIVDLLRAAEQAKAPIVRRIEQYAGYYLPAVLLGAGAVLAVSQDLGRAVAILVVSCPCALVLASPSAVTAALAAATRHGILIKSTRFLDGLGAVDTLILDKTGTVTAGRLDVLAVRPLDGRTPEEVLAEAASCAVGSRHPVSRAILASAPGTQVVMADTIEEVPGQGVAARRNGAVVRLGSAAWLRAAGLEPPPEPPHGGPVVWVARDRAVLGCVLLADRPRPGSREAIEAMRRLGVSRTVLMTGDRRDVAEPVARELGIDECLAGCLPEAKLAAVERERAGGRRVMVVGDGVNDALALARADVGVAMGAMGSAVAVQSADVALMGTDLGRLPQVVRVARRAAAVVNQNVLLAVGMSLGLVTLAGLGLLSPVAGAIVQNAAAVAVVVNSARLLRFDAEAVGVLAAIGLLGLGWGVGVLAPAPALASHGSAGVPAAVEREHLERGAGPADSERCQVAGTVANPSWSKTVTARIEWRGLTRAGSGVATASARIGWLRPGERRSFRSAPFFDASGRAVPCDALASFERLQATAEPVPGSTP
jgi:Cd2+/Zn2+-exporting ATPase/Cu+-exporting ATPase